WARLPVGGCVAFRPDGKQVAGLGGECERYVTFWDADTGKLEASLPYRPMVGGRAFSPDCLTYSPDGRALAVGMLDGQVVLYDTQARKERSRLDLSKHGSGEAVYITSLAFGPDGRTLLAGTSGPVVRIVSIKEDGTAGEVRTVVGRGLLTRPDLIA